MSRAASSQSETPIDKPDPVPFSGVPAFAGADSAFEQNRPSLPPHLSIGAILVDSGRMSPADAEAVIRYQRQHALPFGEAAVRLGVATPLDVEFALSHQFEYTYLAKGESPVDASVVAAYEPFSPEVEAMRALRTQVVLRSFDETKQRSALAIVSAERGDGRSYLAANLAVVFSQLGESVLLIDADMRNPSQHKLFGVENRFGLSSMLTGRSGIEVIQRVPTLLNLSLLPAGSTPPNPQELLNRAHFARLLDEARNRYDAVIIDTPAGTYHADVLTIARQAASAIFVSRKNFSRVKHAQDLVRSLTSTRVAMLGSVLNEF